MKHFVMLSGIPRSGSQVLASLLNQHPEIHATTTSPVSDLIAIFANNWQIVSQGQLNTPPEQFTNIVAGIIDGAYKHISAPIVVDKNRLWPRYADLMSKVLSGRPKIICTVRSIPDILSSYILLIQKNSDKITFVDQDLIDLKLPINNKTRCRVLLEKYIMHPYTSLRMGYTAGNCDMLFLEYTDIVNSGPETMNKICDFIGVDHCSVNIDSLQPMDENDDYHGGMQGLHHVRSSLKKTSPGPEQIIGHELTRLYTEMKLEFWRQ